MNWVHIIAAPLIGGVIGYFTNYIAIKMMFRPYRPIKIGHWTIPFTPGIIPKRRESIARALGNAVGEQLLTGEDIHKAITSDSIQTAVAEGVVNVLHTEQFVTLKKVEETYLKPEECEQAKKALTHALCEKVIESLDRMDIPDLIANEGGRVIKEKVQGTMLALMINDKMIQSFAGPIGEEFMEYVSNHGEELMTPVIQEEIQQIEKKPIWEMLDHYHITREKLKAVVANLYGSYMEENSKEILKQFQVAKIVEDKINAMKIEDVEKMLMLVMKKELNSVINLGALLGFIIGSLNLLF